MTTWLKTLALVAALVFPTAALAEPAATPTLRVDTLDGPLFDLAEQRGKWVIVNYWATWCSPCLKEMPDLRAFAQSRDDVALIGLAYEDISAEEMRAFLIEHPAGYPIAITFMLLCAVVPFLYFRKKGWL